MRKPFEQAQGHKLGHKNEMKRVSIVLVDEMAIFH
jgi:hypothetical protein